MNHHRDENLPGLPLSDRPADDEEAATQRSLLQELHWIQNESQTHAPSHCDDAGEPPISSSQSSLSEEIPLPTQPFQKTPLPAGHQDCAPESAAQMTVKEESPQPSTESKGVPVPLDGPLSDVHTQILCRKSDLDNVQTRGNLFSAVEGPIEEETSVSPLPQDLEVEVDHALLFDGLDADAFEDIELSPPTQRAQPFRSLHGIARPLVATSDRNDLLNSTPGVRLDPLPQENMLSLDGLQSLDAPSLQDPDPDRVRSFLNPNFVGFKTGHGKNVKLSEKALELAKRLFDDLDHSEVVVTASQSSIPSFQAPASNFISPLKNRTKEQATAILSSPAAIASFRTPLREIRPEQMKLSNDNAVSSKEVAQRPQVPISDSHPAAFTPAPQKPQLPETSQNHSVTPLKISSPMIKSNLPAVGKYFSTLSTPQPSKRIFLGMTPRTERASTGKKRPLPRFTTPFKDGKRPKVDQDGFRSPSMARSGSLHAGALVVLAGPSPTVKSPARRAAVFDMSRPSPRKALSDLGSPEANSEMQIIAKGGPDEVIVILNDASKASYYRFEGANGELLSQNEALVEIRSRGCHDATLPWVKNHWNLILWKMAGHTRLCPKATHELWSWDELIRQLLYRYEREQNLAHRSCIKRIQEHDSSAARSMILFVSQIIEEEDEVEDKDGILIKKSKLSLELSDGWYKVQAQVDTVLAQACQRGRLKVGQKLAIMGARLDSTEGHEVLSAYHMSNLTLSANSVSLAKWDARLGFCPKPFVASLRSLTPEGGLIALMDVIILKIFPLAYVDAERGDKQPPAPRGEAEEAEAKEVWLRQREDAQQRLEQDSEAEIRKLEELVDGLASLDGDSFLPSFPEDLFGRLEAKASSILDSLCDHHNPSSALKELVVRQGNLELVPWLLSMAKKMLASQTEAGWMRTHTELNRLFPPRKVRDFRVVRFRDARLPSPSPTMVSSLNSSDVNGTKGVRKKNPYARTVQLTVWDAAKLGDVLKDGQRFLVTNLVPTSKSAWRKSDESADVFLSTRRDTAWRPIGDPAPASGSFNTHGES